MLQILARTRTRTLTVWSGLISSHRSPPGRIFYMPPPPTSRQIIPRYLEKLQSSGNRTEAQTRKSASRPLFLRTSTYSFLCGEGTHHSMCMCGRRRTSCGNPPCKSRGQTRIIRLATNTFTCRAIPPARTDDDLSIIIS